ncbi:uncharacterized protein LOC128860064 isoform X1 [Anastrepha ludens]|uniref:uncharacterized protein LOC128860064 isoform X1 n=1 Tax=Anastrepha ludens TaxID=28586 RepID=UPI0023AEE3BD|nr:uncharacterized protein LOC128860064 isoform X1 [Anastrepha ludens]XP_053953274.1 uncharacterized protein LOC128860064 isoform X1 [Anastrepha ludens]XP_053953275.1 uncharacterized protein LOC128860064 isoform X1 [Anastrepha ludens]XP_053953276.1 uncharacterized protein LOC128860064 isoform X1 [Anastrepha ludens]XP_053953277.1 uncharacterized protein LOC128860064 isoform X1 [Anastrepha ludens]XP_053953278.1 uncharacterized protein LOC128860064 isoform X1 [Anastrepha ludens]
MKRRKLLLCWTILHSGLSLIAFLTLFLSQMTQAAIVPPPWSDPEKNPCASMPGGWQLLYWPPLKQCFKIFTIGYPCPETMELSPAPSVGKTKAARNNAPAAECRCPPGTALSAETNKCHDIFQRGPCERGAFFAPLPEERTAANGGRRSNNRWGTCKTARQCPVGMIYWPKDGKCYAQYTKGPCVKGKLLVLNEDDLGECKCEAEGELRYYFYDQEETCHEHYTKGPCSTPGDLFLPGGRCDCHQYLPHYSDEHQMCYELNSPGPCPPGHIFNLPDNFTAAITATEIPRAQCQCKDGYVPWHDGLCYRLYTRGPCGPNEFLINATSCIRNFCGKSRLYFPDQNTCYRIGSQGPCSLHQVVVFDFTARPSVDGISYNGICGCSGVIWNLDQQCSNIDNGGTEEDNTCESTPGMVEINGNCYKLYTRGPCGPGQWLEPLKTHTTGLQTQRFLDTKAKCVCRPGYTLAEETKESDESELNLPRARITRCNAPTVGLARYLNKQRENSKFNANFNFPNFPI